MSGRLSCAAFLTPALERFCAHASLRVVEPQEPEILTKTWKDVDGALSGSH